ncbi:MULTISPECIES: PLP-dependent aspartate aminotransferase family protein [Gammaproteobacteria]|uniref:trans-sulfuration enzyme family protein n=1 Tax=Gammaproteobacteria TaxID=1236 RepID=UPI000DCFD9CF|nr:MULTISPECIES: aminotransferase class I/II-fold pyridoxal phosphate-dependent enzyme [Gammaproteobacteria]RTE86883.1 aminotransferase class I/II-fold pyridoxal phosphate-dependent enzyme [Aliidiomarina sp. B3213]TCZ93327.1 aminotransferase class I/II-fold pyridoxal phosphate-dependent enzyme [Lysobacter sp. N42]
MKSKATSEWSADTKVAQALGAYDELTQGVVPAIHSATTYYRDADNQYRTGRVYSRDNNPTYLPAERLLADLEGGQEALLFASGMAAAVAVFMSLPANSHVIAPKIMYWSLRNWLKTDAPRYGVSVDFVDMSNLDELSSAVKPNETRLIWVESPANPMWGVTDIKKVAEICQKHFILLAVDSTVATPIICQPLALGADIVMHSATKYLNGHSDVIAGALVCKRSNEYWETVKRYRKQAGAVLSPFDASQLLRGMRTLSIRVEKSSENAMFLAHELSQHPEVEEVLYPGLIDSACHTVAKSQFKHGFTGMMSICVKGGAPRAIAIAAQTQIWRRATSLGSVESLIEHRASIEGEGTPVPDNLLRLSVGIEGKDDLLKDLLQAIEATKTV